MKLACYITPYEHICYNDVPVTEFYLCWNSYIQKMKYENRDHNLNDHESNWKNE